MYRLGRLYRHLLGTLLARCLNERKLHVLYSILLLVSYQRGRGCATTRLNSFPGSAWERTTARLCLAAPSHALSILRSRGTARRSLAAVRSQAEPGNEEAIGVVSPNNTYQIQLACPVVLSAKISWQDQKRRYGTASKYFDPGRQVAQRPGAQDSLKSERKHFLSL
jgi:hypothetical protein